MQCTEDKFFQINPVLNRLRLRDDVSWDDLQVFLWGKLSNFSGELQRAAGELDNPADSDAEQWSRQQNYRLVLILSDTEGDSVISMQTLLSYNWSIQIPAFEQTCTWLYSAMFSQAIKWTFASSRPEYEGWCHTHGLRSIQACVHHQDCAVYLSGTGVIEM